MVTQINTTVSLALFVTGIFLASLLNIAPVRGDSQYQLFAYAEDKEYEAGDTVKLEIFVFDEQKYVNAELINLSINAPVWNKGGRYLEFEEAAVRQATGHYRISFTLTKSDIEASEDYEIPVVVTFQWGMEERGHARFETKAWLDLELKPGAKKKATDFKIDIEVSNRYPRPGEEVVFNVTFTNQSRKVDPETDSIEVDFEAFDHHIFYKENLDTLTRVSTGVYTYTQTVPLDEKDAGYMDLEVQGVYDGVDDYENGEAILVFYEAWLKTTSFTATSYQGTFYVADLQGRSETDVEVTVDVDEYYTGGEEVEINGTTDAGGGFPFNLTLDKLEEGELYLDVLLVGDYQEGFRTKVVLPESEKEAYQPSEPWDWGLRVIPQNRDTVVAGKEEQLVFKAYFEGDPLNDSELVIYITNTDYSVDRGDLAIAAHNKVKTDSTGNFSLTFKTPKSCYSLEITAIYNHSEKGWLSDDFWPELKCRGGGWLDPKVKVGVENFGPGNLVTFKVRKQGLNDQEAELFIWTFPVGNRTSFSVPDDLDESIEWVRLPSDEDWAGQIGRREFSQGEGLLQSYLPEFLPDQGNYIVLAVISAGDDSYFNYVIVNAQGQYVAGSGLGEEAGGGEGFLPGPGLGALLLAMVAVARLGSRPRDW